MLGPAERELEATLSLDGKLQIRDIVWPLAWRFCLEPVSALLGGTQPEWVYACSEQNKAYAFRLDGDLVRIQEQRGSKEEAAFPARELWPALVEAGARVLALVERDRGPTDRKVELLRPALERARAALGQRGWI